MLINIVWGWSLVLKFATTKSHTVCLEESEKEKESRLLTYINGSRAIEKESRFLT